jgi:hypothetical protein
MWILYGIEILFVLGFVSLLIGVFIKIVTYPRKQVWVKKHGVNIKIWVDDNDYHYKESELWEQPTYWKSWTETNKTTNQ